MKKTLHSLLFAGLLLAASLVHAQTYLTMTTLASAVTSTSTTSIQLTSTTGVVATSTAIFVADTASSGELMFVNSVAGTGGYIGVTRGYQTLGKARTHASGTLVFIGPAYAFGTIAPSGSCTRSQVLYLPDISVGEYGNGTVISDCVGGIWVQGSGIGSASPFFRIPLPPPGGVLYTGIDSSGTAPAANTDMYCTELDVPYSKYVTGLAVLNGTTVGTDKHLLILYDATGNLLANSATAGATTSGTSVYQTYAFTSPYYVVGPAKYYGCMQSSGTTDTVRMAVTSQGDYVTTKQVTGQTFGTIAATITVPTTFTTAVGPFYELY